MTLEEQLERDEGLRLKPYTDTVGKLTIGIGRNLTDIGISEDEAHYLLAADIAKVRAQLAPYQWYATLDLVRKAAVENMCFNVGLGSLLHFPSMLHCIAVSDWQGAHDQALASVWATQVGARAQRIATQLLTGEWQ
jgi:lysozyme